METFDPKEIVVIFGVAAALLFVASRLRLPSIVAYILTGVLVGPYGLKLVSSDHVDYLASIGIVLLLFSIGMEFSISSLVSLKKFFFFGGSFQVFFTLLLGFLVSLSFGRPWGEAIYLGCLLSLSSTAIAVKSLDQRKETDSAHGHYILSVVIFQDIITIPMLLVVPFLAGFEGVYEVESIFYLLLKTVLITLAAYFLAYYIIPRLIERIASTKQRELFLLSVLTICFSEAWLIHSVGLPLSLGAFIAGLTISESVYRHQAIGEILPFRDVFICFFFVSIGMLLDTNFVLQHPILIILMTFGVILMKGFIVILGGKLLQLPLRASLISGVFLGQVGEFSFILAKEGMTYQIGTDFLFQLFLAISLFSMALSPYLIFHSQKIAFYVSELPLINRLRFGKETKEFVDDMDQHVVIIGFGACGKGVLEACLEAKIPTVVIEIDSRIVRSEQKKKTVILLGDATHSAALNKASIGRAKGVIVSTNEPIATRRILEMVKRIHPSSFMVCRARFTKEVPFLKVLGADEVVVDEEIASKEISVQLLKEYFA